MKQELPCTIAFGVICDPISKQLKDQGLKFDPEKIKRLQKLSQYVIHLKFAEVLTEKQVKQARDKIFTQIKRAIK